MKKTYIKPTTKTIEIQQSKMLCGSNPNNPPQWPYPGG